MKKLKILLLTCIFAILPLLAISQNSVNAAGGNATSSDGTVTYSLGQIFYSASSGTNGSVLEGVHQPYEIYEIGISNFAGISLNCSVYPNPTSDYLELRITNYELHTKTALYYTLFDMSGKELKRTPITDSETTILMGTYAPQSFILNIYQKNNHKSIKSFKIIKK